MTTTSRNTLSQALASAGLLMIMIAAALPLLRLARGWFGWLYAAGALLLLAGRIIAPGIKDAPLRLRRLLRMEIWTALIFGAGAVFTLIPHIGNDWLAFTMAGGVLTIYTSIMITRLKGSPDPDNQPWKRKKI